jgi:hypothetical protein
MASEPRPDSDLGDQAPAARVRRRVEAGMGGDNGGRSGCLLTGALLGIVVGATFAFYGLPPILRHFYGERHLTGQAYDGDAKTVSVTYVGTSPDLAVGVPQAFFPALSGPPDSGVYVTLKVLTNKTWNPRLTDFSLQFTGGGDWVSADALAGIDNADGRLQFPLTVETVVVFHFPKPIDAGAVPRYLHLADPLIRFELPPGK